MTEQKIKKLNDLKTATMNELLTKGIGNSDLIDSELGSIPKSWKLVKLGEIGRISTSSVNKKIDSSEKQVFLLNYMDIYNNSIIRDGHNFQKVTAPERQIHSSNVQNGDVFFTPSSETPNDIDRAAVFLGESENIVHSYHTVRFRPKVGYPLVNLFKAFMFNNHRTETYFRKRAVGSTRFTLSVSVFQELTVALPSTEEQEKIAKILATMESSINTIKKQLEKLQLVKKGLMEDLLTGKVRVKVEE